MGVVYEFDVPAGISEEVASLDLKMLTLDEEQQAHRRSGGDQLKAAHELTKASLVGVTLRDGTKKKLGVGDGSVDTFWKDSIPPLRALCAAAYVEVNQVKEDDAKSFLATKKIKTS